VEGRVRVEDRSLLPLGSILGDICSGGLTAKKKLTSTFDRKKLKRAALYRRGKREAPARMGRGPVGGKVNALYCFPR